MTGVQTCALLICFPVTITTLNGYPSDSPNIGLIFALINHMNWKKTLKITGISFVALLAILLILPFAFKGKIVSAVQTAANKNLKATVSFNPDLSLSLIRNFPNLSLGIDELKIVGKDSFANDTLIHAPHLRLVVDIASVFSGKEIVIRKIHLQDARANIIFLIVS